MATARRRLSNRCAGSSSRTKYCCCSIRLPPNSAIQRYLNDAKVPHLFIATGADRWNDPTHFPWTIGWPPSDRIEARIWARYILKSIPDAKIALLYQNDDFGMDYLTGLRDGLGDKADKMIVATQSYETSDATIDSQIVTLQAAAPMSC